MRAIFIKEISRLWLVFAFLFLGLCLFFGWFSIDLVYKLKPIHPESVVWYQYVFFDSMPEKITFFVIIAISSIVAIAQFFPQKNRMKFLLHLPISSFKILIYHYIVAIGFFVFIWLFFTVWLWVICAQFYPDVVVTQILINWCYFCLCAIVVYLLICVVLIDKYHLRAYISSLFFVSSCLTLVFYINSFLILLVIFFIAITFGFNAIISHKQTSINKLVVIFLYSFILGISSLGGYKFYIKNFSNKVEKYYIFYSPSLKEFVYQHNLGGHYFDYKTASGKTFKTQMEYKNELAFNYYADLKQQGKTPVTIDDIEYNDEDLKNTRASFTFSTDDMKSPHIPLYPMFNPDPKIAAIPFGEDMLYFDKNKFKVYHHKGEIDEKLSDEINNIAKILA